MEVTTKGDDGYRLNVNREGLCDKKVTHQRYLAYYDYFQHGLVTNEQC